MRQSINLFYVIPYSHVIQSCHTIMSHSHDMQSCQAVLLYNYVIQSCHIVMSYSHVIQSYHTVMHVIGIVMSCHIVIQTCHAVKSCSYVMQSCITWAVSSISMLPCLNSVSLPIIHSPTFTYYHSSPSLLWQYPVLGSPSAVCSMETFNDISEKNPKVFPLMFGDSHFLETSLWPWINKIDSFKI